MICLRCGYCCKKTFVVIVVDPIKGIKEDNLKSMDMTKERCPHLIGDKAGEYSCAIHNMKWYNKTPCFRHGQIERNNSPCRIGQYIMSKENG